MVTASAGGQRCCGKDHRPDRPQVVIGLAVTRDGVPVKVSVWPGNTSDQTVIESVTRSAHVAV